MKRGSRPPWHRALILLLWLVLHATPLAAQDEPAANDGASRAQTSSPFTGLAQAPEANLFSGSAATAIPIDVPPGRKAVTPQLRLTYTSSGGPSPFGHGWDLPIGRIQRTGKRGVLGCSDLAARREFVLSLASGSIECRLDPGSGGTVPCRPIVEQSFVRIELDLANNRWDVWEKNGTHYIFGDVDSSRTGGTTRSPWRDGSPCSYTQTWALTHIIDPNGNDADVAYERVDGVLYPQYVRYGGNRTANLAHSFEVRFLWQERARGDKPLLSSGGHPARLRRLLDRIEVSQPVGATPLRTYDLTYDVDDGNDSPRLARRGFLRSATLFGRAGKALARYDGLPASTILAYRDSAQVGPMFDPRFIAAPRTDLPPALHESTADPSSSTTKVDLRDMNGDGRTDLVDSRDCDAGKNPYWRVYLATNDGFAAEALDWQIAPGDEHRCRIRLAAYFPHSTQTLIDTLDVNGDAIPDWVDARVQPWSVHLGQRPNADAGWGFSRVVQMQAQALENGRPVGALRVSGGEDDWLELLDWNGDGLVDQVNAREGRVHLGTGSGFDAVGERVAFPNRRLGRTKNGTTTEGLYDVNGDGLLDLVRADDPTWQVWLRDGMRFSPTRESWSTPTSCSRGLRDQRGGNDTWRDFFDINGDGLPDVVDSCPWTPESPYWTVTLGSGDGFRSSGLAWQSYHSRVRRDTTGRVRRTVQDVVDMDGDGVVDLVRWEAKYPSELWILHNSAGAWRVGCDGKCLQPSAQQAPADALVRVENGVGGSTELHYLPSTVWDNTDAAGNAGIPFVVWTLAKLVRDAGMSGLVPGSSSTSTDLHYAHGRFDPLAREFFGFGTVQSIDAAGVRETTVFAQDQARKGRTLSQTVHAPGKDPISDAPLRAVVHDWTCIDARSGDPRPCSPPLDNDERVWVRLAGSHVYDYAPDGTRRHAWKEYRSWDRYGNVTAVRSSGDDSLRVDTTVDYAYGSGSDTYVVDRPAHVRVSGGNVEERWFFYDDLPHGSTTRGNLTRTEEALDSSVVVLQPCTVATRSGCIRTRLAYDGFGNVASIVDAEGRVSISEYDAAKIYPVRQTNPLGHVVTSAYDLGCGTLQRRSLPDGQAGERHEFDEFCRPTATLLPGQTAATAQLRISYYLGGPGVATDVFTRLREPSSPTGWLESDDLYDGLGRKLQHQRAAVVDGTRLVLASDTLELEARGLGRASRAPFPIDQDFISGAARYAAPPPGEWTELEHDALGRIVHSVDPSGAERRVDFSVPWQSTATDECFADPSCVGARTVRRLDAYGNTTEKQALDEQGQFVARTRYTFDANGRLLTTQQWDGSRWSTASRTTTVYDSLGRRIRFDDPDSGLWRFGYDRVGNLVYQDDPEPKRHIELCYDELNRLTQKHVVAGSDDYRGDRCSTPDIAEVEYTYDDVTVAFATGRLTQVRDRSGTTTFSAYDAQGRLLRSTRALQVDGFTEQATTGYAYDGGGHLRHVVYPDGERVEYAYDEAGNVRALQSVSDETIYLTDLTYDRFGRPRQLTHGNGIGGIGVIDTREYHGARQLFRLARLTTVAPSEGLATSCDGAGILLDLRYQRYGASGKLAQLDDAAGGCGGLDATATYEYDALARLVRVAGAQGGATTYAYDALGNLTSKDGVELRYDPGRPHRATAAGATGVSHDRNGNRVAKGSARYRFDADDRLIDIDDGAVRIEYDYSGRQAIRRSGDITTRYFDELSEFRIEGGRSILTKHYFVGDHRLASREVYWNPEPTLLTSAENSRWPKLQRGAAGSALLGLLLTAMIVSLVRTPARHRRRLGCVRAGARLAALVALVFFVGTLPGLPQVVRANGNGSATAKIPRPGGTTTLRLLHYHTDHLGSPVAISDAAGKLVQALRYDAYGAARDRWQPLDDGTTPAPGFAFTGYAAEDHSGLQYAGARWYDAQLGSFLSHDPARQFGNPYSYGGGDPINGVDRAGALFGLDDLLLAVVIGAIAGAAGSGIQAAIQGASLGDSLQAAAIGGAIGGAAGYVGAGFVAPALSDTIVPAVATQLVSAGVSRATAGTVAQIAVYGGTLAGGLAQVGHQAAQGNYAPLISLGVAVGLNAALAPPPMTETSVKFVTVEGKAPSDLALGDLRTGDVLITDEGSVAAATEHAAIVVDADDQMVKVLSSDNRGVYSASNIDPAVGGRQWDVYRVVSVNTGEMQQYVARLPRNGGLTQYFGNGGGNVCSSTVAKAVERFSGPAAPKAFLNLATPAQLRATYGPPIGRVFVPLSKGI